MPYSLNQLFSYMDFARPLYWLHILYIHYIYYLLFYILLCVYIHCIYFITISIYIFTILTYIILLSYFKKNQQTYKHADRHSKSSPRITVQKQWRCFGSPLHMELELVLPSKGMKGDQT